MKQKQKNILYAGICVGIYFLIMWMAVPFVYGIIDDRSMMEFVSGQYLGRPDAHAIFLGYWYALALAGLYTLLPNVDWYALGYLLLQAVCMSLILYRVFECEWMGGRKKKGFAGAFVMLLFLAMGIQALVQLTFTTTAAVLGVTVIFWYVTSEKLRWVDLVLLAALCFLTCQIRSSVFLMILPVCAVFWIFRQWEGEKNGKNWSLPLMAAVVLVISMAGERVGYGSVEWQAYREYNRNRSLVFDYADYTLPRFEDAQPLYHRVGIESKSRAKNLFYYNYTADDQISPEFFGEYVQAYEEEYPSQQGVMEKIRFCLKEYVESAARGRFHGTHLFLLAGYAALICWYASGRKWRCCIQAGCLLGVQALMWLGLLYAGRLPERVIYSMNLMMLVTFLLLFLKAWKMFPLKETVRKGILLLTLFALCFLGGSRFAEVHSRNLKLSRYNEDIEYLKKYCMEHSENFYFNDVTSFAFTTCNVKLWREEPCVMNYMSLGDWMSYSPIWEEKLRMEEISSVREALYKQENVYLICSFEKGLEYLTSLYEDVECTEVDKIPGFRIYSLQML